MAQLVLKTEILDKVRKDPMLFGKVGSCLGLSVRRLMDISYKHDPRLTQASVMQILKAHLKISDDNELLTEKQLEKAVA